MFSGEELLDPLVWTITYKNIHSLTEVDTFLSAGLRASGNKIFTILYRPYVLVYEQAPLPVMLGHGGQFLCNSSENMSKHKVVPTCLTQT